MEEIAKLHAVLLAERTHIRNHKAILAWMRKCWKIAPRASTLCMTIAEYDELYATLLCEMTICWDDELSGAILAKMRRRDVSSFADLNLDRFCCSLFFFAEMWVQAVTLDEYARIFRHIHAILSGDSPTMSLTHPTTLASFHAALDSILDLEQSSLNIGKSIRFDVHKYYVQFGTTGIQQLTQQYTRDRPIRRRTIGSSVATPMLCTPCSTKRYHDDEHGDRLYRFAIESSATMANGHLDPQRRPTSSTSPLARDRSPLHITSAHEFKRALSPTAHRIVASGEHLLMSHTIQHRSEPSTHSVMDRLHANALDNT